MKLSLFIARHYFFSKKSTNVINLISLISVVGIAIGTMALIVILSIFNGLEELIISRYNSFDPDFRIEAVKGKTFRVDSNLFRQVAAIDGVKSLVPVVEENALVKYGDKYFPAHLMGVTGDFIKLSGMDSLITAGQFLLKDDSVTTAVIGQSIAGILGLHLNTYKPLSIYVPRRLKKVTMNPDKAFKRKMVLPVGTFSVEPEIDEFILLPISFVSRLLDYKDQLTGLEIAVNKNVREKDIRKSLTGIFGDTVVVKNRFEQHQFIYKIMRTEKVIVFLILALILLIASFNVIGSLTMLIIEKRKDIKTFNALGMSMQKIKAIFLAEGWMITIIGVVLGIVFGFVFCLLQTHFGLIKLNGYQNDAFIIQAYPVSMHISDFVLVFLTVVAIGYIAARYPVRFIVRKYFSSDYY